MADGKHPGMPRESSPDGSCCCEGSLPVVLQPHLSHNPIVCSSCNMEVGPEALGLDDALTAQIRQWQSFHDCFYLLWLDSGEFEQWAEAQLQDPASPVNSRALELVRELNSFRRAYYWWFRAEGHFNDGSECLCPKCGGGTHPALGHKVCERCSILIPCSSVD